MAGTYYTHTIIILCIIYLPWKYSLAVDEVVEVCWKRVEGFKLSYRIPVTYSPDFFAKYVYVCVIKKKNYLSVKFLSLPTMI